MNSVRVSVGTDAALSRLRSLIPMLLSPLLKRLSALTEGLQWRVCSDSFPTCRVDISCFKISFPNIFEMKGRASCSSNSSGKLAVEYVLKNSSVLHAAGMAKPPQPSLTEQGERTRYSGLC